MQHSFETLQTRLQAWIKNFKIRFVIGLKTASWLATVPLLPQCLSAGNDAVGLSFLVFRAWDLCGIDRSFAIVDEPAQLVLDLSEAVKDGEKYSISFETTLLLPRFFTKKLNLFDGPV